MKDKKVTNKEEEIAKVADPKDAQIAILEQTVAELTAGWQRAQADFQNLRRQTETDRSRLIKMANTDLMLEILPVLDNFQLAAKHVPADLENNNWAVGIKQIEKQLENILAGQGLVKIQSLGQDFNPTYHEAVEHIESDKPENEIVEEILAGYAFGDQILRPAKVKVSNGQK
ncbi:MAG: nucleotide exchange factor GrpE [Candidatus Berkelbacteria bacterium]|nr:nucleotide exchange factor GrpE [Candidatus Berkelbacteria bacterium]